MRRLAIRFSLVVVALLAAYAAIAQMPWYEQEVVEPHLEFVARGTGLLLRALGERATVDGEIVRTGSFAFETARGCDAIGAAVIVCSLIFAFPTRTRSKLLGAVVCTAILVAVNFLRTTSLAWIGTHHEQLYDFAHRDVWQTAFALLSLGLFAAWVRVSATASRDQWVRTGVAAG